jgi:small subunit ribosomal protein S17
MSSEKTDVIDVKVKRFREGVVIRAKAEKTITVEITRRIQHKKFKKVISQKIRYAVHDGKSLAKEGDKVRILQTRPISKTKKWTLIEVLSK